MSSTLRPLRLLRATPPYHHRHLCPRFARSSRRQRREKCPRSFALFASFARHLLITYVLVSREVSEGSEGKHVLDPSLPSPPSRDTFLSPMCWFRAKLAKAAKGSMSSILRSLRLLRATPSYHLCAGFARS